MFAFSCGWIFILTTSLMARTHLPSSSPSSGWECIGLATAGNAKDLQCPCSEWWAVPDVILCTLHNSIIFTGRNEATNYQQPMYIHYTIIAGNIGKSYTYSVLSPKSPLQAYHIIILADLNFGHHLQLPKKLVRVTFTVSTITHENIPSTILIIIAHY